MWYGPLGYLHPIVFITMLGRQEFYGLMYLDAEASTGVVALFPVAMDFWPTPFVSYEDILFTSFGSFQGDELVHVCEEAPEHGPEDLYIRCVQGHRLYP